MRNTATARPELFGIDANEIVPLIWQGSKPPRGWALSHAGFRKLILAAHERQYPETDFPGVQVLHAPLDDHHGQLRPKEWELIFRAAKSACRSAALRNHPVLITCNQGLNRSGIITAVCVSMLTGCTLARAVSQVQRRRPGALFNKSFVRQLCELQDNTQRIRVAS